jgi:uncharacterized membrane protein
MTDGIEKYPFGFLTLIVSLESILLSGLILNASNRAAQEDKRLMKKDFNLGLDTNEIVDRMWDEIQELKDLIRSEQLIHEKPIVTGINKARMVDNEWAAYLQDGNLSGCPGCKPIL